MNSLVVLASHLWMIGDVLIAVFVKDIGKKEKRSVASFVLEAEVMIFMAMQELSFLSG